MCAIDVNKLYLVGPVGAWQYLTLRARDVLCRACLVVVYEEDQACLRLENVGVQTRLVESGDADALERVLAALAQGEVAWLVMGLDELAGPANRLLCALLDQGVELNSVPGASIAVEELVASGLPVDRFTALGVLPSLPTERLALWSRFARDSLTVVCEVQGEDLSEVLREALAHLGERRIVMGQADEVWRGKMSEGATLDWHGDATLVIEGAGSDLDWAQERVLDEVRVLLDAGASLRDTAREVARRSGWSKRQVYEWALRASREEV